MVIGTRNNNVRIYIVLYRISIFRYWYGRTTRLVNIGFDRKDDTEIKPTPTIQ